MYYKCIKLFNKSLLDDAVIGWAVDEIAWRTGVKPHVAIIIDKGAMGKSGHGVAYKARRVYRSEFASARERDYHNYPAHVDTQDGYAKLSPGFAFFRDGNLNRVAYFITLIAHELHHILEDQENAESLMRTGQKIHTNSQVINHRRTKWINRPEEQRAIAAESAMVALLKADGIYNEIFHKLVAEFDRVSALKQEGVKTRMHHRRVNRCKEAVHTLEHAGKAPPHWIDGMFRHWEGWCCRVADRNKRGRKSYYFTPTDDERSLVR